MRARLWLSVAACLLLVPRATLGGVDYERDVKPILARRCVACHGPLKQKSGLRLDTAKRILRGGDGGPAVVAGKPSESPLLEAVRGLDGFQMPPEGEGERLPAAEVETLQNWVATGATAPTDEAEPPDPKRHWAFQPPTRPAIPSPRNASWVLNPVDAFLAARHEERGLTPTTTADPLTLLRRVSLDLTGLVPTPEETQAFLADTTPDAYERAVERLLDSPRYGERWGRHLMDVWRYSDWDGYGQEVRESQPHIWRWRDWIVASLNNDKSYDRMAVEMLAADEVAPGDEAVLPATGFLVRNWYKFSRNVWVDNIIEHTSKAFLGITLNCARCHDHKYDPIAQTEYYRFRAVFEPHDIRTDPVPGQADTKRDGLVHVYDAKPEAPTHLFRRGDEKEPDQEHPLTPGVPSILARGAADLSIAAVSLPREVATPGLRAFVREEALAVARKAVSAAEADLARVKSEKEKAATPVAVAEAALAVSRARLTATEARLAADAARHAKPPAETAGLLARLAAMAERRAALLDGAERLARADGKLATAQAALKSKPDDRAKKAVAAAEKERAEALKARDAAQVALAQESDAYTPLSATYPDKSTGRRLALARWITARDNPLAARVIVNHVWMRHFGTPLVPTVTDFGLNGKPPSHPELLDWLAVELMDRGWSLKTLHRLLVTSNAYRMRSVADDDSLGQANRAADPANRDYWRMNARRMEAEVVRDNVLAVAGSLVERLGGPDLDPEKGLTDARRSLYFRHAKEKRVGFLRLFDSANVVSCYRRSESVVPQQALALANGSLTREQARILADTLSREVGRDAPAHPAFVDRLYLRVLGRQPDAAEQADCLDYLARTDPARARASLAHVIFNHNDFVTIR